jgi:hypothetical protein
MRVIGKNFFFGCPMKFEDAVLKFKEQIPGGLAAGRKPEEFDTDQLRKGYEVEFEHTDDAMMALEIAMDHLAEQPDYYDWLADMERRAKEMSMKFDHGEQAEEDEIDEAGLTYHKRKKMPPEAFVFQKTRRYPIHDIVHARNALARVSQHGNEAEKAKVKAAVYSKYPQLKKDEDTDFPRYESIKKKLR